MKKLFTFIRQQDMAGVKSIIDKSPELINSISKGTPKKDDGQSLLQVALKSSSTQIINYLLDKGANVNFIEGEDCSNAWRAPVIHDAINRAIMRARWNVNGEVFGTKQSSDEAFAILKRIVELGADVNAKDSYNNACLDRACLQAKQVLPMSNSKDNVLTKELKADMKRIFALLIENGADLNYVKPNGTGKTYLEEYGNDTIGLFLK